MSFKRLMLALLMAVGWVGLLRASLMLANVPMPPLNSFTIFEEF